MGRKMTHHNSRTTQPKASDEPAPLCEKRIAGNTNVGTARKPLMAQKILSTFSLPVPLIAGTSTSVERHMNA
jgi:alpha-beta hydrolase superfamily lysophospholipase